MTDARHALGTIGQIARSVADLDRAESWYRDVLGLTHLFRAGNMSFFDCGGVRLMLQQVEGASDGYLIYFAVPDIMAAKARLEARGVKFISAPHMIHRHADGTEEWMGFFNDHAGLPLAIMSRVAAAK